MNIASGTSTLQMGFQMGKLVAHSKIRINSVTLSKENILNITINRLSLNSISLTFCHKKYGAVTT